MGLLITPLLVGQFANVVAGFSRLTDLCSSFIQFAIISVQDYDHFIVLVDQRNRVIATTEGTPVGVIELAEIQRREKFASNHLFSYISFNTVILLGIAI